MNKKIISLALSAAALLSCTTGVSAFEEYSYSDELSVYINGEKIDNGEYKPIIVNDRTLVRLVPVFEALGYEIADEMDENKSVTFYLPNTNTVYTFTAESYEAIVGTGGGDPFILDVPATLQYHDVFYVPLRAFCEMTGLDIVWNDSTRSVYVTGNASNTGTSEEQTVGTSGTSSDDTEIGFEYSCFGRIVSEETLNEFGTGTMNYNTLVAKSEDYIANDSAGYETSFGLSPQEALDIISIAYDITFPGIVRVYSDRIEADTNYEYPDENGLNYFRIYYEENFNGQPCYHAQASSSPNFEDENSTVRTLDMNLNVISFAN